MASQQYNPIQYILPPGNQLCYHPTLGFYHVPIQQIPTYYNPYSHPNASAVGGPPPPTASTRLPTAPAPLPNSRTALGNITNTAKRPTANAALQDRGGPSTSKRVRSDEAPPIGSDSTPSVFGVGPFTSALPPTVPEPTPDSCSFQQSCARDVWACVIRADKN